jgi:hypothetical protein
MRFAFARNRNVSLDNVVSRHNCGEIKRNVAINAI